MTKMKIVRKLFAIMALIAFTVIIASCHRSVPCPAYASNDNLQKIESHN